MSRIKKLTLAIVGVFFILAFLFSVNVSADHDDDNYEQQKAAIDRANDGIVGYTDDGIPVYESEVAEALIETTLSAIKTANEEKIVIQIAKKNQIPIFLEFKNIFLV